MAVGDVVEFTLESLMGLLIEKGFKVVHSGSDDAMLEKFRDDPLISEILPRPFFYVTVEGEGGLLEFTMKVTEAVFGRFQRGQMVFDGHVAKDDKPRVTILEKNADDDSQRDRQG